MKHATGRVDPAILLAVVCPGPLQRLVNGVGVGEDVKRRLPVGMLVRGAETYNAQRRRIGERAAEIGGRRPRPDSRLERRQDRLRIIAEELGGELHMIRPAIGTVPSPEKFRQFRPALRLFPWIGATWLALITVLSWQVFH